MNPEVRKSKGIYFCVFNQIFGSSSDRRRDCCLHFPSNDIEAPAMINAPLAHTTLIARGVSMHNFLTRTIQKLHKVDDEL